MSIQLVVFDIAGTTLYDNDFVNVAFRNAMQQFGYEVSQREVNDVMGLKKPQAITMMLEKRMAKEEVSLELVNKIHDQFIYNMISFYKNDPDIKEIEGASNVFKTLKNKGIKVALDTGFSRDITQTIIDRLGWEKDGLIDVSVCSDEVPAGRPHPYMIEKIMQQTGVTDTQAIAKVGDTPSDLEEGKNANTKYIIGVTSGAYTKEELLHYPHTHILNSINDILEIVITE
jgi:phosphonatase-like hydrolase